MAYLNGYQGQMNPSLPVTIANGAQSSSVITTGGMSLCGVKLPAAFTGTALTFEMCDTVGGTYVPVCGSDGNPISYTVAQNKYYALNPDNFQGIQFLKIKSGTTEAGARTLVCSLKGF